MMRADGRAVSFPKGLMIGTLVATIWTVLNMSLAGFLISKEIISYQALGYIVIYILISSAWLLAKIAYKKIKYKRVLISVYAACIYYSLLLIINILCFDGIYQAVGETLLCVCGGAALATINSTPHKKRRFHIAYQKRR